MIKEWDEHTTRCISQAASINTGAIFNFVGQSSKAQTQKTRHSGRVFLCLKRDLHVLDHHVTKL